MVIVDTTVWVDNFDGVHNAETDWLNTGASEQGSYSPQDDRLPDCDILHSRGHSLLHRDRDFAPFETYLGLSVINPSARSSELSPEGPS